MGPHSLGVAAVVQNSKLSLPQCCVLKINKLYCLQYGGNMAVWVRIELSAEDRATLSMWANAGRTEQRLAKRAKVILLSAEKVPLTEISERTGLTRKICSMWRKRFSSMGITGLFDMPGRGRPKVYNEESRVAVLALACTTPVDGSTRWSMHKLAEVTGHSKSTVHAILTAGRLKPGFPEIQDDNS